MSFVGGGSDLPAFYRQFGGAVVSTAIDKYIYINVNQKFDDGIRVAYSKTEETNGVDSIEHPLVRAVLRHLGLDGGIEITTIADVPSHGTGLGSSSSFTVGLLNVLAAFQGRYVSPDVLGRDACHMEIEICREPIGKQDQYAAAFGGLNFIEFHKDDNIVVNPVVMPANVRRKLFDRLLIFYTGISRSASAILRTQNQEVTIQPRKQAALQEMADTAYKLRDELQVGNIDYLGKALHDNWELKKTLSTGVSSAMIDRWYDIGRANGALGGKVLGAGGGGFLAFYAPEERHEDIRSALGELRRVQFGFEPLGSRIIFCNQ
jgi:D-glycero-alpha-D-manno-heptose-7-phosphate kinase